MNKEAQAAHPFFLYQENFGVTKYVQPRTGEESSPAVTIAMGGEQQVSGATPRSPRPRLTSMHSKLDHTMINAAMYDSKVGKQVI